MQNDLQWVVDVHRVVLAQVVSAGWAGVHVSPERPLKTFLEEDIFHPLETGYFYIQYVGGRGSAATSNTEVIYFVEDRPTR